MAKAWKRVAALVLAGMVATSGHAQQEGAPQAPLPAVTVAEATPRDLSRSARFSGRLDADERVGVVARVSGLLLEVLFQPGDMVEEGQVLYRIEPDLFEAQVREAEGALRAAQSNRDLAEIERDRQRELVSRDAAPQAALDNAVAALGRAEGDMIRAEAALQSAQINLSYTEIRAPFPGRVGTSEVDAGALIGPDSGPLVTLIDLDPIHVEFQVPTSVLRNLEEALQARSNTEETDVLIELANGRFYDKPGTPDFADTEVDPGTDSVRIRARFDNPDLRLLDRELVQVELRTTQSEPVLAVPQEAIQRDVQGAFLLVVDGSDTVDSRRVTVGRTSEGFAVITAGLEEGELVVTEGANKVSPGQQVDAALAEPVTAEDG